MPLGRLVGLHCFLNGPQPDGDGVHSHDYTLQSYDYTRPFHDYRRQLRNYAPKFLSDALAGLHNGPRSQLS